MYELQRKEKEETPRAFLPSSLLREAGLGAAGSRFRYFPEVLAAEASRRIRRHCSGICRSMSYCRDNDANEQTEWQFPKPQKIVADHARQGMALVAS